MTMLKKGLITAALFLLLSPHNANAGIYDEVPKISVSGDAELWVVPDKVIINAGVEIWHENLDSAVFDVDQRIARMLNLAKKYKIEPRHVQTEHISIQISEQKVDGEKKWGQMVRRSVSYTLDNLSIFDDIVHDIIKEGANRIYNVQFITTELKKYRIQCRALAIKAARDKALNLSKELDQEIGKAIRIREGQSYSRYWGYDFWRHYRYGSGFTSQTSLQAGEYDSPESEGTIALGQIKVFASVNVDFELK